MNEHGERRVARCVGSFYFVCISLWWTLYCVVIRYKNGGSIGSMAVRMRLLLSRESHQIRPLPHHLPPIPNVHTNIHRLNPDGTQTTLAAFYQGKRINSPNDLTFGPKTGDLYLWVFFGACFCCYCWRMWGGGGSIRIGGVLLSFRCGWIVGGGVDFISFLVFKHNPTCLDRSLEADFLGF